MPMDAVTTPMTPAPMAIPGRTREILSFASAKWCLPFPHERDAVDLHGVDAHLVVQVAPRRRSCGSDTGDRLTGAHMLADADQDPSVADVGVTCVDAAAHLDAHEVAV